MRVLIAGGGIGGLTLALSLHAVGITDIRVVEAAPAIRPLGVGLNILPNAVRELAELGLLDELSAVGVQTGELSYYNRFGSLIWNEPRGRAAGYRWPQLSIHRGRLQLVLLDEVRRRLGDETVVADARVRDFDIRADDSVRVIVDHPAAGGVGEFDADVMVGADGINSAVRAALYPDEGEPPWNGLLVWRGSAWRTPFLNGSTMIIAGDERRRAVVYPMSRPAGPGQPVLMNWALARPAAEQDRPARADWNRRVEPDSFLSDFADLRFDWLDVPELVRAGGEAFVYPMVDRDPLPRWTFGPVTLLGDAAHAMYPMGSNGATQSIVDARVLAFCLARHADPVAALVEYEQRRRPVTTDLQERNRQLGPELVISLAARLAPDGFTDVHEVISAGELAEISDRYARSGGFDVTTVNDRPSYDVPDAARVVLP
ncbi:flavin-dependent oxidoreductase [Micromonospora humidisoli]|uniref:Flavin-dependent oxidoreductase n=1 Tax=Micromonospora humidisoli TaxID=2807622 RepID=A0ABS2J6M8_9ACTN|nr:flavin-dependent oxidoreductase [Micromonospora humidisoli]MBM7081363.1 flavin-dependent oxidoreductase [Micromonospora humidisoli]